MKQWCLELGMFVLQCTWKLKGERMKEMQCSLLAAALCYLILLTWPEKEGKFCCPFYQQHRSHICNTSQCILLGLAAETRNPDWAMPLDSLFSLLFFKLHPCSLWGATLYHTVYHCENYMGPLREIYISFLAFYLPLFFNLPPPP